MIRHHQIWIHLTLHHHLVHLPLHHHRVHLHAHHWLLHAHHWLLHAHHRLLHAHHWLLHTHHRLLHHHGLLHHSHIRCHLLHLRHPHIHVIRRLLNEICLGHHLWRVHHLRIHRRLGVNALDRNGANVIRIAKQLEALSGILDDPEMIERDAAGTKKPVFELTIDGLAPFGPHLCRQHRLRSPISQINLLIFRKFSLLSRLEVGFSSELLATVNDLNKLVDRI